METPLTPVQIQTAELRASKDTYIHRVLVAFDQFINVIFRGRLGETISARSGRAALEGKIWGRGMRAFLDLFQKNHTELAQAGDLERAETIITVEEKVLYPGSPQNVSPLSSKTQAVPRKVQN